MKEREYASRGWHRPSVAGNGVREEEASSVLCGSPFGRVHGPKSRGIAVRGNTSPRPESWMQGAAQRRLRTSLPGTGLGGNEPPVPPLPRGRQGAGAGARGAAAAGRWRRQRRRRRSRSVSPAAAADCRGRGPGVLPVGAAWGRPAGAGLRGAARGGRGGRGGRCCLQPGMLAEAGRAPGQGIRGWGGEASRALGLAWLSVGWDEEGSRS